MDSKNNHFFNILNACKKENNIDINHLTLEEIIEGYEGFIQTYYKSIENLKNKGDKKRIKIMKNQKLELDKLYRFWTNPFHIFVRNCIGKVGIPKQQLDKVITERGGTARLTQGTIDKIKGRYKKNMEKELYIIDSENAIAEIKKIVERIVEKQEQSQEPLQVQISTGEVSKIKNDRPEVEIETVERYSFDTETEIRSAIEQYEVSFYDDKLEYRKNIYGNIDLNRFYTNKGYQRVILEAIEDLEIENYRENTNNKYIGTFESKINNGVQTWQQEINEAEIDAINKIENLDRSCREKAKSEELEESGIK